MSTKVVVVTKEQLWTLKALCTDRLKLKELDNKDTQKVQNALKALERA